MPCGKEQAFGKLWATEKHSQPLYRLDNVADIEGKLYLYVLLTVRYVRVVWAIALNRLGFQQAAE